MKTLLLLNVMFSFSLSFSQDWQTYYSNDTIRIEVGEVIYNDQSAGIAHNRLVFKYINLLAQPLDFSFDRVHAYNGIELTESPERHLVIHLNPSQILTYEDNQHNKSFYIFREDLNGVIQKKLTAFEIKNISFSGL